MDRSSTMAQQAQLAMVIGSELAPFETLISQLMSSSNDLRSSAESLYNLAKQTNPNSVSLKLAHILHSSPQTELRAMSAILLRKLLTRGDSYIYPSLTPQTQASIKSTLLSSIQREDAKSISKKLCDTISELAYSILPDNGWPELLPFMFQCVSSDSPKHQEAAFLIFAQIAYYVGDVMLTPYLKELHAISGSIASNDADTNPGTEWWTRELFPVYLAAPEWQKHHAALIAIAQIAEGCSKVMIKNLDQVVSMTLNSFQDPHPRVRWAAINAIGQLSTDLGPELQVQYHQKVLLELAGAMDDFHNPRVQAHAASAILNFSENCSAAILLPYLDGIVSKLLVLLQNGKLMVQEGALTALASVADSSQEHFQKYYDTVMPYLKAILINATDKSNRMLRAKAMECISLVGMAVGKEKFRDDAKQVMDVLMSLQRSDMETDDPTTSYMLQAWARLCKCLGQEFLPYMSVVMPPLLKSSQLKPDVTISSADSDDENAESDDESMETIILGDKRIGIKTSVLEEKATACNMLCCYADELKEGFYPWIDQVTPTLVPLLKFYFHEEVRKAAISAMPELLSSAKLAVEKGLAQDCNEGYIKQLSDYIIPALVEALPKEPDTEICTSILDALNECLQISGPLLDQSQVKSVVDELKQVITASSSRKREWADRTKVEDFDAEEGELLKEENEIEEEVFEQVGEILCTLVKTFKASFLPFFDELSSYLTPMWGKDKTPEERRIAICIFDDVAEQCCEAALK
ncbi:hypothetical protein SAY86_019448 [Trapa natans]|uniref:Importin N-terminal domain-containing protein n=1 Tax=Trapa natans TaxID=22666 RepID=A0AAN7LNZ6_TRANT|nr:hypothetical protein SAY86_019448 [Trapa natans]